MEAKSVEDKTFGEVVKELPRRAAAMVSKFIGAKGAILALATWLMMAGKVESWVWLVVALVVIFGREVFKHLKDIR
jgi:hypothetical protein